MDAELTILWEGCDGSTWDLLDPFSPVRAKQLSGLGLPGFTQQHSSSAAVDGRRYEGTTWDENTVQMVVTVADEYLAPGETRRRRGEQWRRELDDPWRRSISPEVPGRLVVITGAGRRQLELRMAEPAGVPGDRNPALRGEATYSYKLTADDEPWWTGEEVAAEFPWVDESQPFFGGRDGGSLLFISPASVFGSASLPNPGQRPSWARWWARGPFTSLRVGFGDQLIPLPIELGRDQTLHVDSKEQTIVDGQGGNLWPLMRHVRPVFAPLPAGEEVPLTIEMDGAATGAGVGLALKPRFNGPW